MPAGLRVVTLVASRSRQGRASFRRTPLQNSCLVSKSNAGEVDALVDNSFSRMQRNEGNGQSALLTGREENASVSESSASQDVAPMTEVVLSGRWSFAASKTEIETRTTAFKSGGDGRGPHARRKIALHAPLLTAHQNGFRRGATVKGNFGALKSKQQSWRWQFEIRTKEMVADVRNSVSRGPQIAFCL